MLSFGAMFRRSVAYAYFFAPLDAQGRIAGGGGGYGGGHYGGGGGGGAGDCWRCVHVAQSPPFVLRCKRRREALARDAAASQWPVVERSTNAPENI